MNRFLLSKGTSVLKVCGVVPLLSICRWYLMTGPSRDSSDRPKSEPSPFTSTSPWSSLERLESRPLRVLLPERPWKPNKSQRRLGGMTWSSRPRSLLAAAGRVTLTRDSRAVSKSFTRMSLVHFLVSLLTQFYVPSQQSQGNSTIGRKDARA